MRKKKYKNKITTKNPPTYPLSYSNDCSKMKRLLKQYIKKLSSSKPQRHTCRSTSCTCRSGESRLQSRSGQPSVLTGGKSFLQWCLQSAACTPSPASSGLSSMLAPGPTAERCISTSTLPNAKRLPKER